MEESSIALSNVLDSFYCRNIRYCGHDKLVGLISRDARRHNRAGTVKKTLKSEHSRGRRCTEFIVVCVFSALDNPNLLSQRHLVAGQCFSNTSVDCPYTTPGLWKNESPAANASFTKYFGSMSIRASVPEKTAPAAGCV